MNIEELLALKGAKIMRKANKIKMPVYKIHICEEGAHEFNEYYKELLCSDYGKIVRTPSGGVSIDKRNFNPPMWDVSYTRSCLELTVVAAGAMLRIQFRQVYDDLGITEEEQQQSKKIYGKQAFSHFAQLLLEAGIDINSYAIDNGPEVKKTIPAYLIKETSKYDFDTIFTECHHIDFHNSFPAGLCNAYPEFRPVVEKLYLERKKKPINKAVLNYSIGFFQSISNTNARWAHLSKAAIVDNNKRVMELCERLVAADRRVLLLNTDGIWYQGEIFHGEGEGKGLGQWENDHIDCVFRMKSRGAYEFIENNKYYPVLRGFTLLDKVKPRCQWTWGDIYQKDAEKLIQFYWTEDGLVDKDGNVV